MNSHVSIHLSKVGRGGKTLLFSDGSEELEACFTETLFDVYLFLLCMLISMNKYELHLTDQAVLS